MTKFDFVRWHRYCIAISALTILFSFFTILKKGINYGIDFRGGIAMEISCEESIEIVRNKLSKYIKNDFSVQSFGENRNILIRIPSSKAVKEEENLIDSLKQSLSPDTEYRRIERVGPKVSDELFKAGLTAILLALCGIFFYICIRFHWQFSVCAILALLHDCGIMMIIFAFGVEFSEASIVAFLVTTSYSINDTVVVFDRISEVMDKYHKRSLSEIINISLNETLARTLLTSFTTLAALLVLYVAGGPVISNFSLPILIGVTAGTYSSITIAAPLLLYFQKSVSIIASDKKIS